MSSKTDWISLKSNFIYHERGSIAGFLRENKIKPNGNTSRRTRGWNKERNDYLNEIEALTRERTIQEVVETEAQIRARQATSAKKLQDKGLKAMDKFEPKTLDEARKLIVNGLEAEREALGMNLRRYATKTKTGLNMAVMGTRYGQRLSEMKLPELMEEFDKLAKKQG